MSLNIDKDDYNFKLVEKFLDSRNLKAVSKNYFCYAEEMDNNGFKIQQNQTIHATFHWSTLVGSILMLLSLFFMCFHLIKLRNYKLERDNLINNPYLKNIYTWSSIKYK